MDICSKLMIIIIILGVFILIFDIFGVFDLIKSTNEKESRSAPTGKNTNFPLNRGDGGAPKKSTPKTEVPKGPKVYRRNVPATLLSNGKKAEFLSSSGIILRAKVVGNPEKGIVHLRRGSIEFTRPLKLKVAA